MRPKSIILFERLFFASLALGVLNSIVSWDHGQQLLAADPSTAALGTDFQIFVLLLTWGFMLLFWYFIARRASNIAKRIFIVLFGLGLIAMPFSIVQYPPLVITVMLIMTVIQAYALYFLFPLDAKEWFAAKGKVTDLGKTFE